MQRSRCFPTLDQATQFARLHNASVIHAMIMPRASARKTRADEMQYFVIYTPCEN